MPRLTLIANPAASGFTGALHRRVVSILRASYDVTAAWPDSADDARATAHRAASDGVEVVAAMGGDGVAHHVANGLAGSDTAMALVPAGTTNVLARILGLPVNAAKAATRHASISTGSPMERGLPRSRRPRPMSWAASTTRSGSARST